MPLNPYQDIVEKAVQYTTKLLSNGPSNIDNPGPNAHRVAEARSFVLDKVYAGFNVPFVLRCADAAISSGAGNCGECAAVAFSYLYRKGIFPLDFAKYRTHDHAFIIVGRPAAGAIDDPTQWGPDAMICDPWIGFAGNRAISDVDEYAQDYDVDDVQSILRVQRTEAAESPF